MKTIHFINGEKMLVRNKFAQLIMENINSMKDYEIEPGAPFMVLLRKLDGSIKLQINVGQINFIK